MAEIYTGGGRPLRARLDMCSDLLVLRKKINAADDANKINVGVMAGRRIAAIRRVLLGRAGVSLADELLVPGVAAERMLAELEAVKDGPANVRVAKAAYARGIMQTIGVIQNAEVKIGAADQQRGVWDDLALAIDDMLPAGTDGLERADPVIYDCIDRGAFGGELHAELLTATAGGTDADDQVSSFTRMKADAYDKVLARQQAMYRDVISIKSNPDADQAAIDAAQKDYILFLDEVLTPVENARNEVILADRKKAGNAFARVGLKLISSVMDASPIRQDDAVKWADTQEITSQAVARLRKIGYPVDQLRADMAEFYRFTGGRVSTVRIHSKGDRRANATDIEAHGKVGTINLATSFDKRVLWHELAHHMEADPVAKMAAGRFIRRRSTDGKTHSLRSLSGSSGYRSDEIALKGDFFHPYVGKVYSDGVTEVFSMGVESFSNPELLARRAAVDPQTLEFIAGFVKAEMDPLARAHMNLREIVREMQEEATEATEESAAGHIKGMAATVDLVPDTDTQWQKDSRFEWQLSKFKQIGRFDDSGYYLLSGKVRNIHTKRKCNGLLLVRINSTGWLETTEMPGDDQSTVKAMFAIYRKTGVMPNYYSMNNNDYLRKSSL